MFNVVRFDPKAESRKQKEKQKIIAGTDSSNNHIKKRKRGKSDSIQYSKVASTVDTTVQNKQSSTLYVIAEDQSKKNDPDVSKPPLIEDSYSKSGGGGKVLAGYKSNTSLLSEEAFDDLGIDNIDDLIRDVEDDVTGNDDDNDSEIDEEKNKGIEIDIPNVKKHSREQQLNGSSYDTKTSSSFVTEASLYELRIALAKSKVPLNDAAAGWNLPSFLVDNLRRDGFQQFFPIQSLVIPDVITTERHSGQIRVQDVCITAPTGSGKTLSFVLPILNSLSSLSTSPKRRLLRALVVLPSRDLATQVHSVFETYMKGSRMKVGLAIGQSHFETEQKALTINKSLIDDESMLHHQLSFDPGNLELAIRLYRTTTQLTNQQLFGSSDNALPPQYGWSDIDVLVCTPGRLVDHLDNTIGFTLQHLRYLVVDEADRLLGQTYNNWIDRVLEASSSASDESFRVAASGKNSSISSPIHRMNNGTYEVQIEPITHRRHPNMNSNTVSAMGMTSNIVSCHQPIQLRKFLVSATLTKDPRKLAALRLVNPKHFNVHQLNQVASSIETSSHSKPHTSAKKYSMPNELNESYIECTAEQKPLVLLSLILDRLKSDRHDEKQFSDTRKRVVVVFTASVDSTHRLTRLLQILWCTHSKALLNAGQYVECINSTADSIAEFSSSLKQKDRSDLLQRANDPTSDLSVCICSDGLSRGMDIQYVDTVINYDIPKLAKTYVHRCGRTARASRHGDSICLIKHGSGQLQHFRKMRDLIHDPDRVSVMKIKKALVAPIVPKYRQCIQCLRDVISAEGKGHINHTERLSEKYLPT